MDMLMYRDLDLQSISTIYGYVNAVIDQCVLWVNWVASDYPNSNQLASRNVNYM